MGIFSWFSNKNKTTEVIQQPRVSKKRKLWHQDKCKGSGSGLWGLYKFTYTDGSWRWMGKCQECEQVCMATKRGTSWPHKAPTGSYLDIHTKS